MDTFELFYCCYLIAASSFHSLGGRGVLLLRTVYASVSSDCPTLSGVETELNSLKVGPLGHNRIFVQPN